VMVGLSQPRIHGDLLTIRRRSENSPLTKSPKI
jgi:hypothetical protein